MSCSGGADHPSRPRTERLDPQSGLPDLASLDDIGDLLVVASWYPSVDDSVAGRFVADQVEALAESRRARPVVISFEPFGLTGSSRFRGR